MFDQSTLVEYTGLILIIAIIVCLIREHWSNFAYIVGTSPKGLTRVHWLNALVLLVVALEVCLTRVHWLS